MTFTVVTPYFSSLCVTGDSNFLMADFNKEIALSFFANFWKLH